MIIKMQLSPGQLNALHIALAAEENKYTWQTDQSVDSAAEKKVIKRGQVPFFILGKLSHRIKLK